MTDTRDKAGPPVEPGPTRRDTPSAMAAVQPRFCAACGHRRISHNHDAGPCQVGTCDCSAFQGNTTQLRVAPVDPDMWTCGACRQVHGAGVDVCQCAGEALRLRARPGVTVEVRTYDAAPPTERAPSADSPPSDPMAQVLADLATSHPDIAERLTKGPLDERLQATAKVSVRPGGTLYSIEVVVDQPGSDVPLARRLYTQSIGNGVRQGALPRVVRRLAENALEHMRDELGAERTDWHAVSITMPDGSVVQPEPIE